MFHLQRKPQNIHTQLINQNKTTTFSCVDYFESTLTLFYYRLFHHYNNLTFYHFRTWIKPRNLPLQLF